MLKNEISIDIADFKSVAPSLKTGDRILLSGTVYTARDAAHKKIFELIANKEDLPFELYGSVIYYAGPTPAPKGLPIGSCGPTTSCRMDDFAPLLYDRGLAATIGKGDRSPEVYEAIKHNSAVYLCAVGGAGALAAKCIIASEVVAFPELGCESIKKLLIKDFPLIVAIDSDGGSLFIEEY